MTIVVIHCGGGRQFFNDVVDAHRAEQITVDYLRLFAIFFTIYHTKMLRQMNMVKQRGGANTRGSSRKSAGGTNSTNSTSATLPSSLVVEEFHNPPITYTEDHFSNNITTWEKHLLPLLEKEKEDGKGSSPRVLILGAGEGLSSVWLARKAFGGSPSSKDASIWAVDTPSTSSSIAASTAQLLEKNVKHFGKTIKVVRADSTVEAIGKVRGDFESEKKDGAFSAVYVDVDHSSKSYLEAGVLAYPLLKPGGLLLFNNYTHDHLHTFSCPRPGIDAFAGCYSHLVKIVDRGWELVLMKRRRPLHRHPCRSEYYHEKLKDV